MSGYWVLSGGPAEGGWWWDLVCEVADCGDAGEEAVGAAAGGGESGQALQG